MRGRAATSRVAAGHHVKWPSFHLTSQKFMTRRSRPQGRRKACPAKGSPEPLAAQREPQPARPRPARPLHELGVK